ncbi:hypothetical protein [Cytophaga aurantiaca]|uniref:hypothetical protein n=1 Tax=Cytophaga aurantiaca TaxID=29530 RepID=UPI000380D62E|nr:hypothetical protein [Cytophaga aurantiaca]
MKNIETTLITIFLFIWAYSGYCTIQADSIPSYYSSDKKYFSFTASTYTYLPNSTKDHVFIYKIFKGDSLIDHYWITNNHIIKLKEGNSDFLSSLITKDTVTLDQILSKYRLTEKSYSARFDAFFQIEFKNTKQKTGRVYGCGQDRKGHKAIFNIFTLHIKRNDKILYSKKIKMGAPKISEFENNIKSMTVFYSKDQTAFIAYGEYSYCYNAYIFWIDDQIVFCNNLK